MTNNISKIMTRNIADQIHVIYPQEIIQHNFTTSLPHHIILFWKIRTTYLNIKCARQILNEDEHASKLSDYLECTIGSSLGWTDNNGI